MFLIKTLTGGFRYENSPLFWKKKMLKLRFMALSEAKLGYLFSYSGTGRPSSARTFFMSSQTLLRFSGV
jgi:hypothetical protein